jgi:two-component system OmpR family sensor kinase
LRVEDAGPGIPPERREVAQQRFQSLGGTGGGKGSGLGLAIVRAVAQAHGARMVLGESRLGGLSVDIRFPEGRPPVDGREEDGEA